MISSNTVRSASRVKALVEDPGEVQRAVSLLDRFRREGKSRTMAPRAGNGSNGQETADLVVVCPHMGDGGVQRVISMLANAWSAQGHRIQIVTLYKDELAYPLHPSIRLIPLYELRKSGLLLWCLERMRLAFETAYNAWLRFKTRMIEWLGGEEVWVVRAWGWMYWRIRPVLRAFFRHPMIETLWKFYLPLFIRVRALRRVIGQAMTPVVVGFCGSANIMTVLACKATKTRVIISERNDPSRQALTQPWNYLRRRTYGSADVVTANSRGALDSLKEYVPPGKLAYIPNPLLSPDLVPPAAADLPQIGIPWILIVARLHPQKAHDVLLDAFALLPARLSAWRLAIVGRGEAEQELRARSAALGLQDRVDWFGQVDNPFDYYRRSEIFVLPSRHEGTPNALLEAMSCGLAAVVSDASPGPLELIHHEKSGLVVPVDNAPALAHALTRLADDPSLRKKLGAAAREAVAEFNLPNALTAWENLIGW